MRRPVGFHDLLDGIKEDTLDLIDDTPSGALSDEPLLVVPANREDTGVFVVSDSQEVMDVAESDEELVLEPTTLDDIGTVHTEEKPLDMNPSEIRKMIGILFCQPRHGLSKHEIIPGLDFFHLVKGERITCYLPGYGADWPEHLHPDREILRVLSGETWLFSDEAFNGLCSELENRSTWRYSGGVELLLLEGSYRNDTGERRLDFSETIQLNLEVMVENGHIASVRAFLEQVLTCCTDKDRQAGATGLSNDMVVQSIRGALAGFLTKLLPGAFKPVSGTIPFCVRNLELG